MKTKYRVLALVLISTLFLCVALVPWVSAESGEDSGSVPHEKKSLDEVKDQIRKQGLHWTAKETALSNLTDGETLTKTGGTRIDPGTKISPGESAEATVPVVSGGVLPSSFDWRANPGNYVTAVKDQGCGDCWAFASAAALESKVKIVKGDATYPVDLSEQQIKCFGHGTCTPWDLVSTFNFLQSTGTPYEACFPYVAGTESGHPACDSARCPCWNQASLTKVPEYLFLSLEPGYSNSLTSDQLKTAIMQYGPVPVYMMVYDDFMYYYAGGVYQHTPASYPVGGHFVTVIGWDDADQAWICKNSWGTGWGEDPYGRSGERGYFRIAYAEPPNDFGFNVIVITALSGPADNADPMAEAGGPYYGYADVPVNLTGSGSDTAGDCIVARAWDLDDDGVFETAAPAGVIAHTWLDDFFGTIWFRVRDSFGAVSTDSAPVTIGPFSTTITVEEPNGGETYYPGSLLPLRWRYTGIPGSMVKIEAYRGQTVIAVLQEIPLGAGGSGSHTVTIPASLPAGSDYSIRITSISNPAYSDRSNGSFAIVPPSITLVTPNDGGDYVMGEVLPITWNYTGTPGPTVRIDLLAGSTVLESVGGIPVGPGGSGSFEGTLPYRIPAGDEYYLRVTSTGYPGCSDTSDAPFTVRSALTVTEPDGGEIWPPGSFQTIRWTYTGTPGTTVTIEALRETSVIAQASGIPIGSGGNGSYPLTVPAATPLGGEYRIRVASTSYPTCTDTSDSAFIVGIPAQTACTSDWQCVAAQCCHATGCINALFQPDCTGIACTLECSGPLDCGAGHCGCVNGTCTVIPGPA